MTFFKRKKNIKNINFLKSAKKVLRKILGGEHLTFLQT